MPFRGTSKQRLEVWRGARARTTGGLTKTDLIKNKRGKIVSKKKSTQASSQNNLGNYLRETGKSVDKGSMLRSKGSDQKVEPKKAAPKPAPKPAPKKVKPAPKAVKAAAPKPAFKKPKAKPAKKPAPKAKASKAKPRPDVNPVTGKPYEKAISRSKVNVENVVRRKLRKRGGIFG